MDKKLPAGSIKIEQSILENFKGERINILPLIIEFNIYESIMNPFITANIVISNSLAMTSAWPIVGQEIVYLTFKTPHDAFLNNIDVQLQVIGIEKLKPSNVRTESFVLKCVAPEMIQDQKIKIRQSFRDTTIGDMANEIFQQNLLSDKEFTVTPEFFIPRTLVIPNMSPSRTMYFLADECEYPGTLFFQNLTGFYFTTISDLVQKNRLNTIVDPYFLTPMDMSPEESPITQASTGSRSGGASRQSTKPFEFLKIKAVQFESLFNYNKAHIMGGLESTIRYLNPISRTYIEKRYNYFDDIGKITRISKNSPHPLLTEDNPYIASGEARTIFKITNFGESNEYESDPKPTYYHYDLAEKALLENTVVSVVIPGDSEKRAGQIVNLTLPEFGATEDVIKKENRYISGEYLILECRHVYNGKGYDTIMKCTKNAYEKEIA